MLVTKLVTSSITAITSWLGTDEFLPSTFAAMEVRARVAFSTMVTFIHDWFVTHIQIKTEGGSFGISNGIVEFPHSLLFLGFHLVSGDYRRAG